MNTIPKVVFSNTLEAKQATWPDTTIANGTLNDEIAKLKKQPGGEIIAWGGARFAQSLARAGLIDEYAIISRPVAYGGGKPLFVELEGVLQFDVLARTSFQGGFALNQYRAK